MRRKRRRAAALQSAAGTSYLPLPERSPACVSSNYTQSNLQLIRANANKTGRGDWTDDETVMTSSQTSPDQGKLKSK
jgi:hypothetical protein